MRHKVIPAEFLRRLKAYKNQRPHEKVPIQIYGEQKKVTRGLKATIIVSNAVILLLIPILFSSLSLGWLTESF